MSSLFFVSSPVLTEIEQFYEKIKEQRDYIETCLPKLAKFYLKYQESVDEKELKRMVEKKKNLNLGNVVLFETICP